MRVWCKFDSTYRNPLTGRVGRWRVLSVEPMVGHVKVISSQLTRELGIVTLRNPRPGSIISPRKELAAVLGAYA